MGVVATSLFDRSELADPVLTPRQKELQKIAIEAEHTPFFSVPSPVGKADISVTSSSEDTISQTDIVNPKRNKLGKGEDVLYEELNKKFKRISPDTKDLRATRNNEYIKNRLDYMFMEKKLWYKASFEDTFSHSKMTLFFKFLQCNKKPQRGIELDKTCYTFEIFSFKNGKWFQANISSQVIGLVWYNDIPYAHIDLTEAGEFSKETNFLVAVVPVPNEPRAMQYLKYESGKYQWIEGREISWTLSSQKEMNKFRDWVDGYDVEHGEQPE